MRSSIIKLLKEVTQFKLDEQESSKWTDDALRQLAAKFSSLKDFQSQEPYAYKIAKRKGDEFFNEITSHIEKKTVYTPEQLMDIAREYSSITDFIQNNKPVYSAIRRRGDDFFKNATRHMKPSNYKLWTDDELRKEALKFTSRTEFQKSSPNAEAAARSRGKDFFDDITSHMILRKKFRWTDEELEDVAKKYNFRGDFLKYDQSAYNSARKRGDDFFNKITSHMGNKLTYWTDEMIRDEASKFKTKSEFQKNSPNAYGAFLKRDKDFQNRVSSHMVSLHKTWTEESLRKEAQKYKTPSEFYEFSNSAAQLAMDRGRDFYEDITSHMDKLNQWTEELLKQEALKYKSISEFQKYGKGAYSAAVRLNILDDITMHMEPIGNLYNRLIYVYEFPDNHFYVGLTYNLDKRDRSHMKKPESAVYQHMMKTGLKPIRKSLTDYMDNKKAKNKERDVLNIYIQNGWTPLNKAKTGSLGGNFLKWSQENIRKEADKYDTLSDFYKFAASAVNAAKQIGSDFYNDVTSHMTRKSKSFTDDELKQIAANYQTKIEFRNNNERAYNQSIRRGKEFFNAITQHMVPLRKKWNDENVYQEALKYKSKKDFARNSGSAYNYARIKGKDFFNQVTAHMNKK